MSETQTWVIVASRDHARRGLDGGFVMANHGKRGPLARMAVGDRVMVYSPKTSFPDGEPLKAVTIIGTITGDDPEASEILPGGFRRRADLREIYPVPLTALRDVLPTGRIRFGFFGLEPAAAEAAWRIVSG